MAQLDSTNYSSLYQQLGSWVHMHNITLLFDCYQYYLSMVQTIQLSIARKKPQSEKIKKKCLPAKMVCWNNLELNLISLAHRGINRLRQMDLLCCKNLLLQGGPREARSVACCLNSIWYERSLLTNLSHPHFHAFQGESETVLGQMFCGLWLWNEGGSFCKPHCF